MTAADSGLLNSAPNSPNTGPAYGAKSPSSAASAAPSPGASRSASATFSSACVENTADRPSGSATPMPYRASRYVRPSAASSGPSSAQAGPEVKSGCAEE